MKRFIEGDNREQGVLFPDHLEDFVGDSNPVRAVDAFVDALDLVDSLKQNERLQWFMFSDVRRSVEAWRGKTEGGLVIS